MNLMRLIYFSTFNIDSKKSSTDCQLTAILATARRNNSLKDITGALIFDENWFVQILEGERDAVWSTYKKIEKDDRHSCVTPIEMAVVQGRCFGNWWMAFAGRNSENNAQFAAYSAEEVFDPSRMLPDEILSLMINLTCQSPERELGIAGISMAARFIRERPSAERKTASTV